MHIGRKAAKVSRLGADPTWKSMWRLIRTWVCHNHKVYYGVSITWAFLVYQFWWNTTVGYYRQRNHHRSIEFAIQAEEEWELNKPKEEEYDEDASQFDQYGYEADSFMEQDGEGEETDEAEHQQQSQYDEDDADGNQDGQSNRYKEQRDYSEQQKRIDIFDGLEEIQEVRRESEIKNNSMVMKDE